MKLFLLMILSALALSGCGYCLERGELAWVPYHCKSNPNAYPVPNMSPCTGPATGGACAVPVQ